MPVIKHTKPQLRDVLHVDHIRAALASDSTDDSSTDTTTETTERAQTRTEKEN